MHVTTIESLVARAVDLGCPAEPLGLPHATEADWRLVLAAATQERGKEIADALDTIARQRREEVEAAERQHREDVLAGVGELNTDERAIADQERDEASEVHERLLRKLGEAAPLQWEMIRLLRAIARDQR